MLSSIAQSTWDPAQYLKFAAEEYAARLRHE